MKKLKSNNKAKFWWEGGSLHDSTFSEYLAASIDNKMATLADIVIHLQKNIFPNTIHWSNPNELLVYVSQLMTCLDSCQGIDGSLKLGVVSAVAAFNLEFIQINPLKEAFDVEKQEQLEKELKEAGYDL